MRHKGLLALGACAVLGFAIATLPASLVAGRVARHGVEATSWTGTIWSGTAQGLAVRGQALGTAQWSLSPSSLLAARLGGHARLAPQDGRVDTDFSLAFDGDVELRALTLDVPLAAFAGIRGVVPRGWTGRARGHFETLDLQQGWPTGAQGTLELVEIAAPPPRGGPIGSYRLEFSGDASASGIVTANVTSSGGPLSVEGALELTAGRNYDFQGTVARAGVAATGLDRAIEMLGPPDASGRRSFGFSGTL
jgi:hypothetical protein